MRIYCFPQNQYFRPGAAECPMNLNPTTFLFAFFSPSLTNHDTAGQTTDFVVADIKDEKKVAARYTNTQAR
jgi:hypothetical protein